MYTHILKLASLFYKIANEAYEEYRDQIEELSRQNPHPFSQWFDENGRAYIEFSDQSMTDYDPGDDKWVIGLLEDEGWTVTDYKAGYATKGNRTMRIGKIIPQIRRQEEQKWKQALQEAENRNADEFEIENLKRQRDQSLNFINEQELQFINSPNRAGSKKGGLMIVISQNPHDLASMSTGRSWESCMTLGSGSHHSDVFCEVSGGGLVAYLIDANDKNIQRPHARIHIRRFDSANGNTIAIPEQSVYGNDVEGFQEAVQNWIDSMQEQAPPGIYERKGGKWSDTFGRTHVVTPEMTAYTPEGQQELISWANGTNLPPEAKYDRWRVEDLLYDQVGDDYEYYEDVGPQNREALFLSKQEAEEYIQEQNWLEETDYERESYGYEEWNEYDEDSGEYKYPRFKIVKETVDNTQELRQRAARKLLEAPKGTLSEEALNVLKEMSVSKRKNEEGKHVFTSFGADFIKKYPEVFTKEELSKIDNSGSLMFIKNLPDDQKEPYLKDLDESIKYNLRNPINVIIPEDVSNTLKQMNAGEIENKPEAFIPGIDTRRMLESKIYFNYMKHIEDLLREVKRIPEETVQELIQFANRLPSYGLDPDGDTSKKINDHIIFNFGLKNIDSPVVQDYYLHQLNKWSSGGRPGLVWNDNKYLAYAIGRLGENGKQFLPFLNEKLEEAKKVYNEYKEKSEKSYSESWDLKNARNIVESLLSSIDSIKNGTGHSNKYKFHL